MEINATTFILQILNFLILVWILQRLLYKPVLALIAKRKQSIDQSLEETKKLHHDAEGLRSQYESRQQLWQQEKAAAQAKFREELEAERRVKLEQLNQELEQIREKEKIHLARQQEERRRQVEKEAMENGARFAGLLLRHGAGPELEKRLISLFLERCSSLKEKNNSFNTALNHQKQETVEITSAYPIADDLKQQLEQKISRLLAYPVNFKYSEDSALIAGIRMDIGACVTHLNIEHELKGFVETAYEPSHN